jgi:glycosyltransferase involved in cell wall biosynthesis
VSERTHDTPEAASTHGTGADAARASGRPPVVGFVAINPGVPSFRLRLAPLLPLLQQRGVETRTITLPRRPPWLRVWRLARAWQSCDLLLFSKIQLRAAERSFVARRCPTWVLDVDDAIMFRKPHRHGDPPGDGPRRRRRFRDMVTSCRLTVAASQTLASAVADAGGAVLVLPTPVPLSLYPPARAQHGGPLRLAWIGLGANMRYLRDLTPVLRELHGEGVALELCVVSDHLPEMPGVACRLLPWSERDEAQALASCDIGLAPLPDDAWTRGKGAYRSIQYAAAGLPTVASPVGANCEVVAHGVTGLWASTPAEWAAALRRLAADEALRNALGAAARERAREYDRDVIAPRYAELLAGLLPRDPR